MLDLREILESYSIPYIDRGPNIRNGCVGISCPLCGDDPSFHLQIHIEDQNWFCWRDRSHKGRNPRYLFRKLLGLSDSTLDALFGARKASSISDLRKRLNAFSAPTPQPKPIPLVDRQWPADFRPITDSRGASINVFNYMVENRKYFPIDARKAVAAYDLRCTMTGPFACRVIFPIHQDGRLVGWTGRDITGKSLKRYNTDDGGLGETLIYAPRSRNNLVIVEGPFDALRLNMTAKLHNLDIAAWATLTTGIASGKISRLCKMIPKGSNIFVAFDQGASGQGIELMKNLAIFKPRAAFLPQGVKDPDELKDRALPYLKKILSGEKILV